MSFKVADSLAHSASVTDGPADPGRRDFIHIAATAAAVGGVAAVAWPLIDQLNPAADTLALASIEYDVTKVALGQEVTISWRKQPVFVRHRTPRRSPRPRRDDHAPMKDPATDASRVSRQERMADRARPVCTHLGCMPTFGDGDYGGWLCPCHGSVYDTAGAHPQRSGAAEPGAARLHLPHRHQDQGRLTAA